MKKVFLFLLAIGFVLFGCSQEDKTAEGNQQKESEREGKGGLTEAGIYPLTGLESDGPIDNRIVSVMVNNHPDARPQSGLSKADIVFEILVEGNITRFMALYHSEMPDVVGPVRSAREYYFDLANGYDALYVYHGAAGFIDEMIEEKGTHFLNGSLHDNDGHLFKRESFRKAPHNSYLQLGAVYEMAEQKGYPITATYKPLPFLDEEEVSSIEGEQAQHIVITYSETQTEIVEFDYDADAGQYKRFSNGVQTAELNSEEVISAENIFIIETHHEVFDDDGRRMIDIESGGNAYLIQKGKVQRVEWKNVNGRILPVLDGREISFVPGKTWINIVSDIENDVKITN